MLKQTPGKMGLALLVCLVFGGCASTAAAQSQASATSSTLYKRLGGYDAIAAVTDDFIGRLGADKQLGRFLFGLGADSHRKLRPHVVDHLCEAMGWLCFFICRWWITELHG